jgi:hypothetical protein
VFGGSVTVLEQLGHGAIISKFGVTYADKATSCGGGTYKFATNIYINFT